MKSKSVQVGDWWRLKKTPQLRSRGLDGALVCVTQITITQNEDNAIAFVNVGMRKAITVRLSDFANQVSEGEQHAGLFS